MALDAVLALQSRSVSHRERRERAPLIRKRVDVTWKRGQLRAPCGAAQVVLCTKRNAIGRHQVLRRVDYQVIDTHRVVFALHALAVGGHSYGRIEAPVVPETHSCCHSHAADADSR